MVIGRLLGAGLLQAARATALIRFSLKEGEEISQEDEEQWVAVSSTAIRSIGWQPPSVIVVEFNQRGTYSYSGDFELFQAFVAAPSKGKFFNANFR